jgi:hypothetical protein
VGDPFQAILGRPSAAFGQAQGIQGQASGLQQLAGPALFNPESAYAGSLYSNNAQQANAANIAQAQVNGGMIGGALQGLGSLAGVAAIKCWVAREVYGESNPQWRRFRTWMLTRAPQWFQNLYIKHGEKFAAWVSDKPRIKSVIRRWMDSRIATLGTA